MTDQTATFWRSLRSRSLFLMSVFSLSLCLTIHVEAKDIQWQKSEARSAISLRRVKGDALAVRQRLIGEGSISSKAITELSHLTSGCALTLHWQLAEPSPSKQISSFGLSSIQPGSRRLAKQISQEHWPNSKQETRSSSVNLTLPHDVTLHTITWHRCGWAPKRETEKESSAHPIQNSQPTLPSGAKSSRARGLGVMLGQKDIIEPLLTVTPKGSNLILTSEHWSFAVILEGSKAPTKTQNGWRWHQSPSDLEEHTTSKSLKLKAYVVHNAPDLTPLSKPVSKYTPYKALKEWEVLLDFLSYEEGIIDGLGAYSVTREWAALLMIAVIPKDQLLHLSTEWCEAALLGATRSLPAWPHIFKAYKRPMKPLDGRLLLPIALERYLLEHPQGAKRLSSFVQRKIEGIAITSVIKRHLQDMISRVAFFANRPSKKHLISVSTDRPDQVQEGKLHYSFTESVALVPRSLDAITRLLLDKRVKASLGVAVGLELRAEKLQGVWMKEARSFFGRQLEVYEARARLENWGRFLELPLPDGPALAVQKDIKYYNALLNQDPPHLDSFSGLDMLWGQHDDVNFVRLLNTMRPFPAGIITAEGVVTSNRLPFVGEVAPISTELLTPSMGAAYLWLSALNRQLKRQWPYKFIMKIEDARAGIWAAIRHSDNPHRSYLSSWQSNQLSVFDSAILFAIEPPPHSSAERDKRP